ncbi:restriction endonuclease subunit S [Cloacibacillus evryensis]|uniref:restriction endonuclease subunit S n=1 Tax=Cloacibacillus evryensis TaxID=508460 RepID=UPI00044EB2E4|nr:restriction endonuclease subunit S [Cloacibacillus evryensis]EXG78796.1 type I restriction-modification system methylase family protein [Cloacibacillus evryensis DSM 19522]
MKVIDLFSVEYGVNLELLNCEGTTADDINGVNFVSRTASNNGVVAVVKKIDGVIPQKAGTLSCAGGGSVLETFVQTKPYYSGRDLYVLTPKKSMTIQEKLFYCMCIKANAYRYNYGRQANKTLKDIQLPDIIPSWVNSTPVNPVTTKNTTENALPLDKSTWEEFPITRLFNTARGKMGSVTDCESGDIPLVTAYTQNNGVSNYISCESEYVNNGNCLTVANTGQGSVFRTFYQPSKFVPSNNVTCLTAKGFTMNKYIGLFITTLCWLEIPRYSYGRIVNNTRLEQTVLKLPVKKTDKRKGVPDWSYMENYIKSLPYGDKL